MHVFSSFCNCAEHPRQIPNGPTLRNPVGAKTANKIDEVGLKWLHFMLVVVASLKRHFQTPTKNSRWIATSKGYCLNQVSAPKEQLKIKHD